MKRLFISIICLLGAFTFANAQIRIVDALDKMCEVLDCQPSDLMEYVKED